MVRMSDLVRGIERKPAAAQPTAAPPETPPAVSPPTPTPPGAPPRPPLPPPPAAAPPTTERPAPLPTSSEAPDALFAQLQGLLMEVRELVMRRATAFPWGQLESMVDRVAASLRASADLFWVANNPSAPPGLDYVACHQARVAVLALRFGTTLNYDPARLRALGMAACLMDVALWQMSEALVRRMDAVTGADAATYQAHPRLSAEIVRRWGPPSERIATAIAEHHEREHGQGFPQGLEGASIDPDAKILGLVDTYAALTLPPSSRPPLRPHEAIRDIVKSRQDAFPAPLIKALLSEISVFPPGTVVRLNTEEVGRVIAVNRNHPLRPKVEIMADGKGHRLMVQKIIDLSEAPFLYITGPVGEAPR